MKFRSPLLLLCVLALPLSLAAEETAPSSATPPPKATPAATPRLTILKRVMKSLGMGNDHKGTSSTGFKGLDIGMQVDPPTVKVGEAKQLKVTITLVNLGRKMTQLEFPTTQRIEVLVKGKEGKVVETWSEDQSFSNDPSQVTVNPDERLEYTVTLSTRDMVAGETYNVEAFFPNYEKLRKAVMVNAVK